MTGLTDAYAAEVDGKDIEGRISTSLEDTTQTTYE
jgi:hypothetical protein